jgi:4-hydroxybenzoate polyprenyltransferase
MNKLMHQIFHSINLMPNRFIFVICRLCVFLTYAWYSSALAGYTNGTPIWFEITASLSVFAFPAAGCAFSDFAPLEIVLRSHRG